MGKLFYTDYHDHDHYCTAAAVNSESKNLIMTAAHCLYHKDGPNTKPHELAPSGYFTEMTFVPRYMFVNLLGSSAPFGVWQIDSLSVSNDWKTSTVPAQDQGFAKASLPLSTSRLVDVVGGNGLTYGGSYVADHFDVWGYPVEEKYEGYLKPVRCYVSVPTPSGPDLPGGIRGGTCDLTRGASGGPWMKTPLLSPGDVGIIRAVTSIGIKNAAGYVVHGATNNLNTKDLYDAQ